MNIEPVEEDETQVRVRAGAPYEWVDLRTGEAHVEEDPTDAMIAEWQMLKEMERELNLQRRVIEDRLVAQAESIDVPSKTRSVAGEKYEVKVALKTREKWDVKALIDIQERVGFGEFAKFFGIKEFKPNRMPLKKLQSTANPKAQALYKDIARACTIEPARSTISIA